MSTFNGPKVVLIGMPASAKSRVGRELATLLSCDFFDLDALIESKENRSITEIFETDGEGHFRELETISLKNALSETSGILSLGGGTLTSSINRQLIQEYRTRGGFVVYLDVSPVVAIERIKHKDTRPIFNQKGAQYWVELLSNRESSFLEVFDLRVRSGFNDGSFVDATDIAQIVAHAFKQTRIPIIRDNRVEYEVIIGDNLLQQIPSMCTTSGTQGLGGSKVAVLYTEPVARYADQVVQSLARSEINCVKFELPDAEDGKTFRSFQAALESLAQSKFTRKDFIVAVGGGALTDAAGFIASSFLRGIKYINIPTSLLAMVDASTGGKTAINLESGKNLCGAFYEPKAVYCDLTFLASLPEREYIEAFGEITKMGLVFDSEVVKKCLYYFQRRAGRCVRFDDQAEVCYEIIESLVRRCVELKANVVGEDLYDNGLREFLNYGHTFGHAVEKLEHYEWRHGEAVAVGMMFAANLARELGMLSTDELDAHQDLLSKCHLPISWTPPAGTSFNDVLQIMRVDKKATTAQQPAINNLRFVLLDGLQNPKIITNPPIEALERAYAAITTSHATSHHTAHHLHP
jgi:shikimate kinase/3-dehydroquinate synthase